MAGHHRPKAALELGFVSVPVEIHDVDADEAESQLIADNVSRWRLNPMEQARLIKRLKERAGIHQGSRLTSVNFTEVAGVVGVELETAKKRDRLNKLIRHSTICSVRAMTSSPIRPLASSNPPPRPISWRTRMSKSLI